MNNVIKNKVNNIIIKQLGIDANKIKSSASFIEDLGADSLDTVELIMALEEEFNTEIPDEEAEKIKIIQDVYNYIEKNIKKD